jgi:hypothetical protein
MSAQKDLLIEATEELRQALGQEAAGGQERGQRVARALAGVERALRQRAGEPLSAEEPLADSDRPLLPSPGVERRAEGLRHEAGDLLREVRALRGEVSAGRGDPAAGPLAERLGQLVHALAHHEQGEIDLVQESITTDIGAGD